LGYEGRGNGEDKETISGETVCPGCINEEVKSMTWYQEWYEKVFRKYSDMGYKEIPHFCIKEDKWK